MGFDENGWTPLGCLDANGFQLAVAAVVRHVAIVSCAAFLVLLQAWLALAGRTVYSFDMAVPCHIELSCTSCGCFLKYIQFLFKAHPT